MAPFYEGVEVGFNNPGTTEFKSYFTRDFPYGSDPTREVIDSDITKALTDADTFVNAALFPDQGTYTVGFLNLAAHFMVLSIQSSSQGISGAFEWLTASKGVGGVSASSAIPQRILDNAEFSWLSKTNYGAKYLMMVLPQLSGQVYTVCGSTRP